MLLSLAGGLDTQLTAHQIGGFLCHHSAGGSFSSSDGHETVDAVCFLVIEAFECARQAAA
jgi:hypothetical protein